MSVFMSRWAPGFVGEGGGLQAWEVGTLSVLRSQRSCVVRACKEMAQDSP